MQVQTAYYTDVGNEKDTNEDSLCIQIAETGLGTAVLAVVCDGMGGLSKGELASATVVRAMQTWFEEEFPGLLGSSHIQNDIRYQWDRIIKEQNRLIGTYGKTHDVHIGTTLTALLLVGDELLIGHIGDTRVYRIGNGLEQLTKDHTVTNHEIQFGHMTPDEAESDLRRHVLLQCIGASKIVEPDFIFGTARAGECYLLCSDGFRDKITEEEMAQALRTDKLTDEAAMEMQLAQLAQMNMQRGEKDNITAILIKI
ncbi:MAG: PP2C family protein-serine/threonine phosphatase [Christensenellaceae bacterium]|jgi:serine/threonine protein phosphatase PrpC